MGELWIKTRNCEFSLGRETTLEAYDRFIHVRKVDWIICSIVFPNKEWARSGLQKIMDSISQGQKEIELTEAEALFDLKKMNWRKD